LLSLRRAFGEADAERRGSPHPRVELEIAAVRAARRPRPEAIDALIAKVDEAVTRMRAAPAARTAALQPSLLDAAPAAPAAPQRPAATPPAVSGASAPVATEPAAAPAREADTAAPANLEEGLSRAGDVALRQ